MIMKMAEDSLHNLKLNRCYPFLKLLILMQRKGKKPLKSANIFLYQISTEKIIFNKIHKNNMEAWQYISEKQPIDTPDDTDKRN